MAHPTILSLFLLSPSRPTPIPFRSLSGGGLCHHPHLSCPCLLPRLFLSKPPSFSLIVKPMGDGQSTIYNSQMATCAGGRSSEGAEIEGGKSSTAKSLSLVVVDSAWKAVEEWQ